MNVFPILLGERIRRDRWQLLMWIVGTALLAYTTYVGVTDTYGTEQDRRALLATAIANPVIMLFRGLPSGAGAGAFIGFLIFPFLAMLAALMSTFLAVRHTRMDEELGRAELDRRDSRRTNRASARYADPRHPGEPRAGHPHGAGADRRRPERDRGVRRGDSAPAPWASHSSVSACSRDRSCGHRGARTGSPSGSLLLTFLMAGIGNAIGTPSPDLQRIESSWLTWLSPFGWGENSRPFADDNLWPLLLCAGFGLALAGLSVALQSSRDIGESLVPERRGRADAGAALAGPTALWSGDSPVAQFSGGAREDSSPDSLRRVWRGCFET